MDPCGGRDDLDFLPFLAACVKDGEMRSRVVKTGTGSIWISQIGKGQGHVGGLQHQPAGMKS